MLVSWHKEKILGSWGGGVWGWSCEDLQKAWISQQSMPHGVIQVL